MDDDVQVRGVVKGMGGKCCKNNHWRERMGG